MATETVEIDRATLNILMQSASEWCDELEGHIIPDTADGNADEVPGMERELESVGRALVAARRAMKRED